MSRCRARSLLWTALVMVTPRAAAADPTPGRGVFATVVLGSGVGAGQRSKMTVDGKPGALVQVAAMTSPSFGVATFAHWQGAAPAARGTSPVVLASGGHLLTLGLELRAVWPLGRVRPWLTAGVAGMRASVWADEQYPTSCWGTGCPTDPKPFVKTNQGKHIDVIAPVAAVGADVALGGRWSAGVLGRWYGAAKQAECQERDVTSSPLKNCDAPLILGSVLFVGASITAHAW